MTQQVRVLSRWGTALVWALFLVSTAAAQDTPAKDTGFACANCHSQPQDITGSPHEQLGCASCHGEIQAYPHPQPVAKPECTTCHADVAIAIGRGRHAEVLPGASGCALCHADVHQVKDAHSAGFKQAVPDSCGACHTTEREDFGASAHGSAIARGRMEAPVCSSCHQSGHEVVSLKATGDGSQAGPVVDTCAGCHADVRLTRQYGLAKQVVGTFEESFHGAALRSGVATVASCASCHGAHKILPPSNAESKVAPQNLSSTCGQCHPGAGRAFQIGRVHVPAGEQEPAVYWVRLIYRIAIPLLLGFMALHHLGDWLRKTLVLRFAPASKIAPALAVARGAAPRDEAHFRMHRMERIQHGLLIVSFVLLVWTGFALRFSNQWWAQPVILWEGGQMRGVVHRMAGAAMIALAVLHIVTLIVNPGLRNHWKALLPKWRDLREAFQQTMFNIGLRKTPPVVSSHSYIEKVEYWAMVWGTLIMAVTGLMLWANTLMLTWAPRVALDLAAVIHFYEAILATLAILVWHFYMVIFDPEVYPVDPAWLTGYSVRDRGGTPE